MAVDDFERVPPKAIVLRTEAEVAADSVEFWLGRCLRGRVDHHGSRIEHQQLLTTLDETLSAGLADGDCTALLDVHRSAYAVYEMLIGHPFGPAARHERSCWLNEFRCIYEERVLAADLAEVAADLPATADATSPEFVRTWFLSEAARRSTLDSLVENYLADTATAAQLAEFIQADGYLNYRFYDAITLTQPHFMESVKNQISRHVWDEAGKGDRSRSHTQLFSRSLATLGVELPVVPVWEDWRPYAGHNLYFLLGCNRRHLFKALGSLAMPELFDVDRDDCVVRGMHRLGYRPEVDFEFFVSHIEGDAEHGPEWLDGIVLPIVAAEPAAGPELMAGGALRMLAMRRYNEYLATKICRLEVGRTA
ncbi:iron-containing redox enzyme family protein [Nocardia sp. NPDC003963]